jgi:hypothetical protein
MSVGFMSPFFSKHPNNRAGFIAEILTLAALQGGKNVLQDGSLRDAVWYKTYFLRLKEEFPALRQSILHVTAPRDAVFKRAAVSEVPGTIVSSYSTSNIDIRFALCLSLSFRLVQLRLAGLCQKEFWKPL